MNKTKDISVEVQKRAAVPVPLPAMPDIWIQELDADSTTQECDQDSTNKGEN